MRGAVARSTALLFVTGTTCWQHRGAERRSLAGPLTWGVSGKLCGSCSQVAWLTWMQPGWPVLSMRDAVLTVSLRGARSSGSVRA